MMSCAARVLLATLTVLCGRAIMPGLAGAVAVGASVAVTHVDRLAPPRTDGRLPAGVRPTRYALALEIDPSKPSFSGRARIAVRIDEPTSAIVMHGRGMKVRAATLLTGLRKLVGKAQLRMAAGSKGEPEELVLAFDEEIPRGDAQIDIDYEAPFANGLRGLYRVEQAGAWYAFTQFEPNDARRAFPCFDEPGFKTPFEITITAPQGATAVANTRQISRSEAGAAGLVTFGFEPSQPLPSYLVAFAVGPFDILEGPREPVAIRLIACKGRATLGKLSVETAAAHLALLATYFDRSYPYSKLDIVAVPNFGAGAMENAGLVTFREELLLLDPDHASSAARRTMAAVVAHELAHQWFGDLVTMSWWDDLWLNEAFASWMSDKIVDQWRPETKARLNALSAKAQVMGEDALATARKIRNPVRSTSEAEEAFDGITYSKGRAVLTMVEAWLGEDVFRAGIRGYVRKHEWGNATASDLYAALDQARSGTSGSTDVARVMDSFTGQTGVPLLRTTLTCPPRAPEASGAARHDHPVSGPAIHLRQQEYRTLDRKPGGGARNEGLWRIPVCVAIDAAGTLENRCTVLDSAEGRIDLGGANTPVADCPKLLYPNAGEAGYYRVHVGAADLAAVVGRGPWNKLGERERFGLVSNAWAAVWSGELPVPALLDFLTGFRKETSRLVWGQIVEALQTIDRVLVSDRERPVFAKFVRDLLGPTGRSLGWTPQKGETEERRLLREIVLSALGRIGEDRWALSEAGRLTRAWLSDPAHSSADVARIALPLGAKRGDVGLFDRLHDVLRKAGTPEMRLLALSGLIGFEDADLVRRGLALTLDGTIKAQDFRYVFGPLGRRRATRDVTFAWIEEHFDQIVKIAPSSQLGMLIRLASALCDVNRVRAAGEFLRPRVEKIEGTGKDLRQALEEGLRCAALVEKESDPVSRWLAGERSAPSKPPSK